MHWPQELWLNPPLLLLVVLASVLMPLPAAYHPLTFYRYLAFSLAQKVNPDPLRASRQLYISGSLAVLVATVPVLALSYSLYQFSELPWLLDALLLFACIDWPQRLSVAKQVQHSLARNQLTLAREQAAKLLLRRTDNLSAVGVSKACCESLLLRSASEVVATLFWFLAGGGLAALGYRLLLELHQQWNVKLAAFKHFGRPVSAVVQLLSAPALLFCCLCMALHYGIRRSWHSCRNRPYHIAVLPYWLLCCASTALQRGLGGPVYYGPYKLQRSRTGHGPEPAAADIAGTVKLTRQCHGVTVILAGSVLLLQLVWLRGY